MNYSSNPNEETPPSEINEALYKIKYGYARSYESQIENDKGQDFLAFRLHHHCISFVVCDGVSLSFCGDVAASFLGTQLLTWLDNARVDLLQNQHAAKEELFQFLTSAIDDATDEVKNYHLPAELPPLLKEVLEDKREQGSETMFVCGRIDFINDKPHLFLGWSGDLRIRFWNNKKEVEVITPSLRQIHQRWSTKKGIPPDDLHVLSLDILQTSISELMIYTDGLAILDPCNATPSLRKLYRYMQETFLSPESDDLSFLNIVW
ncbi:hypothetical protein [Priestia koreensis]|uniref:hypothetical protein n=1 Tax=Priestia koreensis TaxID=284581 RepID=UPI001F58AC58|nr:hypothetical protein [Priestia koreensis]MCM3006638.1 hypothetical protein [Priestia koreensis]UNL84940.1 hypothetical protein IE339_23100 [Priestia koreensis]